MSRPLLDRVEIIFTPAIYISNPEATDYRGIRPRLATHPLFLICSEDALLARDGTVSGLI
jgi:hypothetical protein